MITEDYLPKHKEIKVFQDDEMLRINSDTMVLGEFLNIYRNDTVLDMGTNQGALLLYASLFNPKELIGLEINEGAVTLAKKNMEVNNVKAKIIHGDIITYKSDPVDVIICNPPYFKTKEDNKGKNSYKALAKHESELTLKVLIESIERNLKDNGTLFFLFLSSRLDEVMIELRKKHLIPKVVKFVFDKEKKYSNVFLVKAVKNDKIGMNVEKSIVIER